MNVSEERTIYRVDGEELRRETRLPFASGGYKTPTAAEIVQALKSAGIGSGQAARIVGVGAQRVRGDWMGGKQEIPYAPWRLLLIHARLALGGEPGELEAMNASQMPPAIDGERAAEWWWKPRDDGVAVQVNVVAFDTGGALPDGRSVEISKDIRLTIRN